MSLIINTLAQLVDLQCLKKFFIEYQHVSKTGPKKLLKNLEISDIFCTFTI